MWLKTGFQPLDLTFYWLVPFEIRIQNRTELITRKHQEKEDSRLTPEEKAAEASNYFYRLV